MDKIILTVVVVLLVLYIGISSMTCNILKENLKRERELRMSIEAQLMKEKARVEELLNGVREISKVEVRDGK